MGIKITEYNLICNLGNDINAAFNKAIEGVNSCFKISNDFIKSKEVYLGLIDCNLPSIDNKKYDLRCNKIILKCLEKLNIKNLISKYKENRIGVVVATTNSGIQEFESTKNIEHSKVSNSASFIKEYFNLKNYYTSISTACSSGIKAFSIAVELLNSNFSDAVIVVGIDAISKVPIFGFDSLEILSSKPSNPFSKNRCGINIAEGAAAFILEKDTKNGIEIAGIGQTTDTYHTTTPDPEAIEAINAINSALLKASIKPEEIDYINLHGTGTLANDFMEAVAINKIFKTDVSSSSTKPLTGHCLGAAASVEVALCCKLLEKKQTKLFPHIFDNEYDSNIPKIKLVKKEDAIKTVKNVLCTSFGFGGTNAAIVLKGE